MNITVIKNTYQKAYKSSDFSKHKRPEMIESKR